MGTFAMNFNVLVPVFSKEVLNVEEAKFGLLMSFMGVGSFIGSLIIASRSKKGPNEIFLIICSIIVTVFLFLNGLSSLYVLSAILLGVTGIFTVMFFTTANTLLQLNSKDEYRGRVISVYTLFFAGTTPFGNLFTGSIAQKFGAKYGFIINSLIIIVLLTLFYVIKMIIINKSKVKKKD
jgi:MFS family permease